MDERMQYPDVLNVVRDVPLWNTIRKEMDGLFSSFNPNLAGVNLSNTNLNGINLRNADLRHSNLSGAAIRQARFDHAILRVADLSRTDVTESTFFYADMSHSQFHHTIAQKCGFDYASLIESDMQNSDLSGACFYRADLRHARLRCSILDEITLGGCLGNGKEIISIDIDGCSLVVTRDLYEIDRQASAWSFAEDETEFNKWAEKEHNNVLKLAIQIKKILF